MSNAFEQLPADAALDQILLHPNEHSSDIVRQARLRILELGEDVTVRQLRAFLSERGLFRFEVYSTYMSPPAFVVQATDNRRAGFPTIEPALRACYNHQPGVRSEEKMGKDGAVIQSLPDRPERETIVITAKDVGEIKL